MAVKTEKDLTETQRAHWLKAVAAIELRNFGYAISLLQAILKQEPQFLNARQLLRRSEVTKHRAAKKSFFNISTATIAVMKAQREVKKDPRRAVEMIEKVLEEEPYNRQANMVLKEAAVQAGIAGARFSVIDSFVIPNLHQSVFPAISGANKVLCTTCETIRTPSARADQTRWLWKQSAVASSSCRRRRSGSRGANSPRATP